MKKLIISLSTIIMIITGAYAQKEKADLVIINGKVLTIDKENPTAQAIAIKGEKIIAVGKTSEISALIEKGLTKVIDAKGRLVLPGFNDAHVHFGTLDPDFVELRYTTDPSLIAKKVKAHFSNSRPGELISGGHWEHEMFIDKKWPTKELIDSVSPDNPVILSRADGHSLLVNSYVLKASGITKNTPDPFGGVIQKDPVTGEPTGIIKENAQKLIKTGEIKTKRTVSEDSIRLWQGYLLALKEAREDGVTSVQIPGEADFDVYEKLQKAGELTCRIDIGGRLTED